MDERSQHGYPQQHQLPQEHGHAAPQAPAPWPTYAPQQPNAPIAGRAPYPGPAQQFPSTQQFPSAQQFQYAANGYVLPGAGSAQAAPMSAHGGTIGVAQPPAASAMPTEMPAQMPVPMVDAHGHPQAWAFPTPHGLQLVQPGTSSMAHAGGGMVAVGSAHPTARRVRWETIVPALAVACLIAAIGLFMHDFDRITGRDASASTQAADSTTQVDAEPATPKAATPDVQATVDKATTLFRQGSFGPAANLLRPLLAMESPDPAAVALYDKVDRANARTAALLKRLAAERRGKRWTAVVGTIGQLERLRPLDRQLVALRTRARTAITQAKARAAAQRAAAKARNSGPSTNGGGSGGGNHSGHAMPPAAGGSTGAGTGARPPADVPKGSIPAVPNVPNPSGAGAGVVGGGAPAGGNGSNCHTHDGVVSCHD